MGSDVGISWHGSSDGVGRGYGGVVGLGEVGHCKVGRNNLGSGEVGHD